MLVLTRKDDEEVVITTKNGETIILKVIEICGNKVRLGFDSEKSIKIYRKEVQEKIQGN